MQNTPEILSVEQLLNKVSYSGLEGYMPSDFALKFLAFIKMVNGGEGEQNKSPVMHYRMLDALTRGDNRIANMLFRGSAKALDVNTLLVTPNGFVRMGDIAVGEYVVDREGNPTKVTHVSEIFTNQCYEITLNNGDSFVANADHLHIVNKRTMNVIDGKRVNCWKEHVVPTQDIVDSPYYSRAPDERNPSGREPKWFIPKPVQSKFNQKDLPFDPYTLGVILGDGSISEIGIPRITTSVGDLDEILGHIPYEKGGIITDKRRPNTVSFNLKDVSSLLLKMFDTGDKCVKYIPQEYLFSSVRDRIDLLRGLLDTDGTISKAGAVSFCSTNPDLVEGVKFLVSSLGGFYKVRRSENGYKGYWKVTVQLDDINPFYLSRKAAKWRGKDGKKTMQHYAVIDVKPVDGVMSKCISVDSPTKSYLIENCQVTHNTTVMGEYMCLYLATYNELPNIKDIELIMYVSDSIENGVRSFRENVEYRWENSEFLQLVIPEATFTHTRLVFTNANGKTLVCKSYGAKTGIRGVKERGRRPQVALLDDLVSDDDAKSDTEIANIEATVYNAIEYALHPTDSLVIWNGTPFNARDPLYKAINSGAWTSNVYPVCERFPCSKEEFRGAWEDRFPYEAIVDKYNKAKLAGKLPSFYQELMLRITSDDQRIVDTNDMPRYSRTQLLRNKHLYNFYITTDFATTEKQHSDLSVISVWAVNSSGMYFLVDGVAKQQLMSQTMDDLFRMVQKYRPMSVGIEISGQQGGFISWINSEMMHRNIWFTLAREEGKTKPGIYPKGSKLARMQLMLPKINSGQMFIPEEIEDSDYVQEFLAEMGLITNDGFRSKYDDILDTVSMLGSMSIFAPSLETAMIKNTQGIWEPDIVEELDAPINSYLV